MIANLKNIIISRTDSIGDVMLTLPLAKFLKAQYPDSKIFFLGKKYTQSVVETCTYVDSFLLLEDFLRNPLIFSKENASIIHVFPVKAIADRAKQLGIQYRIGTANRFFHWTTCNKLVRLSRKNSHLHEAQLNTKLLSPFGIHQQFSMEALSAAYGFTKIQPLPNYLTELIDNSKFAIILHPKSKGSAREWGLNNFIQLIKLIDKTRFQIFISGTQNERDLLIPLFEEVGQEVVDITGKMNLTEFIAFINNCHVLVANSTGPLHIASALRKLAIGIYPPIRPMHPERWAPIGKQAHYFVINKQCNDCRKIPTSCSCITAIHPLEILALIEQQLNR